MSPAARRQVATIASASAVLLAVAAILVPILWIAAAAFKRDVDVYQFRLFFTPTLENFGKIFQPPYNIHQKGLNSLLVALATIAIAIPMATLAAYGFSRFHYRGERAIFMAILGTQFLPAVAIVLPFFILFRNAGLLDTRVALIIVNLAIVTPFAVWMIKGFIDGIPVETEEAAMVDGSSRLRVIRDIVLPMAAPGIAVAAIFSFILAWNEFFFALILTTRDAMTLPIGLALFKAEQGDLWNLVSATGVLIMIPMFILTTVIQRHFVQGITMGAVR